MLESDSRGSYTKQHGSRLETGREMRAEIGTSKGTGISLRPSKAIPFTFDHCSNCGIPVMMVYVVYEKKRDKGTGEWFTTKGRYEVRHAEKQRIKVKLESSEVEIEEEQVVMYNGDGSCPVPERSPLYKYLHTVVEEEKQVAEELETKQVVTQMREPVRLPITLLKTEKEEREGEESMANGFEEGTEQTTMSKREIIQAKIAAAKAKKVAGGGAGVVGKGGKVVVEGKAASLTGKKKVAQPKKEKEPKAPRFLNLCGDGCGEKVKNKFAMGHDARFHGWLKRLGDGRMKPNEIPASVAKLLNLKKKGEGYVPGVTEEGYLEQLKGRGGQE